MWPFRRKTPQERIDLALAKILERQHGEAVSITSIETWLRHSEPPGNELTLNIQARINGVPPKLRRTPLR